MCYEGILQGEEADENITSLRRKCEALIKTFDLAKDLLDLDLESFNYVGENEARPDVLLSILPTIACTPRVSYQRKFKGRKRDEQWNREVLALYPALRLLFDRKGSLNAQDVRDLGKEVQSEAESPLIGFAGFLQEEGLSEEIAQKWNKRYG